VSICTSLVLADGVADFNGNFRPGYFATEDTEGTETIAECSFRIAELATKRHEKSQRLNRQARQGRQVFFATDGADGHRGIYHDDATARRMGVAGATEVATTCRRVEAERVSWLYGVRGRYGGDPGRETRRVRDWERRRSS
jgi:hypothetical protein